MHGITVVTPRSRESEYLREAWRYRELLWFFARRDLLVRYRQTALGVAWVLIRPVLAMGVFALLFGTVAGLSSHGVPYPLLVLTGMIPWQFVASVLSEGTISVAGNSTLITKTYFPRILMPASSVVLNTADLLVNLLFLAVVMTWYGVLPGWQIILLPLPLLWVMLAAFGASLWLAALMVFYRDVRGVVPVALQFGLLVTPVAWTVQAMPEQLRWWAWVNPLAGPIELARWCILPAVPAPAPLALLLSAFVSVVVVWSGYLFFRRAEAEFADVI